MNIRDGFNMFWRFMRGKPLTIGVKIDVTPKRKDFDSPSEQYNRDATKQREQFERAKAEAATKRQEAQEAAEAAERKRSRRGWK